MKSNKEKVYELLVENKNISNSEIEDVLQLNKGMAKVYINRLKQGNFIDYEIKDGIRYIKILEKYKDRRIVNDIVSPKFRYYEEMLEIYMNDFRSCENFQTRVKVGQEIRLLIKEM